MNNFAKHYTENFRIYDQMVKAGKISPEDIKAAGNMGGNVPYAEQDAANARINEYLKEFAQKNKDIEEAQKLVSSFPVVQKFTPNKNDWQNYNQEQLGRLAEEMKFNWRNKEDRSQMMKQLQDETIRRDKKKIYADYKKENPVASFINEHILAPNVSQRMKKGEDITNTDLALDAANVGTFLIPGAGAAAGKGARAAWLAADAAAQGAVGAGSDINQGNELGVHNIVQPLIGAGAGAMTELVPRMAKGAVDAITQGFGGRVSKPVGDVGEDWITKVFGDAVGDARKAINKEVKEKAAEQTVRKNASEASKKQLMSEGKSTTANAADKQFAKDKKYYMDNPEKWKADIGKGKISESQYQKFMSDPNFKKVITHVEAKGAKKVAQDAAKGVSRAAGRDFMIVKSNQERAKNAKPSVEKVFASPELADWVRLKKRGYNPQIPAEYKDYEAELNKMIHDPNRNLR